MREREREEKREKEREEEKERESYVIFSPSKYHYIFSKYHIDNLISFYKTWLTKILKH